MAKALRRITIPSSFKLGGRTWHVVRGVPSKKWYGMTRNGPCRIELSTKNESPEAEEHAFLHELIHAICFTMGWDRLNEDERKIDALAVLLQQALSSAK